MTGPRRGPARRVLQVHPTRRCNLACTHCYTESGPRETQSVAVDRLRQVVTDAADLGYDYLAVSGGEPLLYPGLHELVRAGHDAGMQVAVTTNGTLRLTERLLPALREVDVLAISVDGTERSHDTIRGRHAFRRTDRTLADAGAAGLPWGAIFTLTQHNLHDLPWVVAYAAHHGARFVQVHPLGLAGRAATLLPDGVPDEVELAAALVVAQVEAGLHGIPVLVDVVHRAELEVEACGAPLAAAPAFADAVPVLTVLPDGLTLPLHHAVDPALALGNIHDRRLTDLARDWIDRGGDRALDALRDDTRRSVLADGPEVLSWLDVLADRSRAPQTLPV